MDILFVHENISYGGAEKMLFWVARQMKRLGHNVSFCFIYDMIAFDNNENFNVSNLHLKFARNYFKRNIILYLQGSYLLYKEIKKSKSEHIICFGFNSFIILSFVKLFLKFKLLVSERGNPSVMRFNLIRQYLFGLSDFAVFQTPAARRLFLKVKDNMCEIIPNPVRIPNELWQDENAENVIISVGRLHIEQKRQDVLIKAFALFLKNNKEYKLQFVGEGDDINRLKEIIRECQLDDYVIFSGFCNNVNAELIKARMFVLSSDFEGIPNALLEAMAIGMPVVSTDCTPGGARFLIRENNGIIVPTGDIEALAFAMNTIAMNKKYRRELSINARTEVMKYTEDATAIKWNNTIRKAFLNK